VLPKYRLDRRQHAMIETSDRAMRSGSSAGKSPSVTILDGFGARTAAVLDASTGRWRFERASA
jgi:hypothetical protein